MAINMYMQICIAGVRGEPEYYRENIWSGRQADVLKTWGKCLWQTHFGIWPSFDLDLGRRLAFLFVLALGCRV